MTKAASTTTATPRRNHHQERNRRIREAAEAYARETICFERPGAVGCVEIVAHGPRMGMPAQRVLDGLSPDDPKFDERLMAEFGIRRDQLIRLSESWAAPTPWSPDIEQDGAEDELAEFRAQAAVRERADQAVIAKLEARVAELEAERAGAPAELEAE